MKGGALPPLILNSPFRPELISSINNGISRKGDQEDRYKKPTECRYYQRVFSLIFAQSKKTTFIFVVYSIII